MELVRLDEVFEVVYGNQMDLNAMGLSNEKDGIAFISRSSQNQGFITYVDRVEDKTIFPKGSITVTLGGSYLLASFVQQRDFYTAQNIKVLTPKQSLTLVEKLFYCACIIKNRCKYTSHGREANKTLSSLQIPAPADIPKWVYETQIPTPPTSEPFEKGLGKLSLKDREWGEFIVGEVFEIAKGERLTKEDREIGNLPLIVASGVNNGAVAFISEEGYKNKKIFSNKVTLDIFFHAFYQGSRYFSDDNVHTLFLKNNKDLSPFGWFFIAQIFNMNQYKYAYGRQTRIHRLKKEKIQLPITPEGTPDWQFMEDYIKGLPYSKNLRGD